MTRAGDPDSRVQLVAACTVAAGFCVGHLFVTDGWTRSWDEWELQPFWVSVAALAGAFGMASARRVARDAAHLLVALAVTWLVVWPGAQAEWQDGVTRWVAVLGLGVTVWLLLMSATTLSHRVRGPVFPMALLISVAASGGLALFSGYAKFVQASLVGTVLLLPAMLALLWRRGTALGRGTALVANALLLALVLGGYFHLLAADRAPAAAFALVAVAPSCLWLAELNLLRSSPRRAMVARLVCVAAPVIAALALARFGAEPPSREEPSYEEWTDW